MLLPRGPGSVDATYLRYLQVLARVGPMGHFSLEILDPIATLSLSHGYKLVEPDIQHRGGAGRTYTRSPRAFVPATQGTGTQPRK